jgi:hypothetical protein
MGCLLLKEIILMRRFKLGDRVRVIGNESTSAKLLWSRVGKIIKVSNINYFGFNKGYVCLDIERELDTRAGGIWMRELELIDGNIDLSHIKQFGIVKFLNSISKGV